MMKNEDKKYKKRKMRRSALFLAITLLVVFSFNPKVWADDDVNITVQVTGEELNISNISEEQITENSAAISWNTNVDAKCRIKWGTTDSYGLGDEEENDYSQDHSKNLSELLAGTTYHYNISCTDRLNHDSSTNDRTFMTAGAPSAPEGGAPAGGTTGGEIITPSITTPDGTLPGTVEHIDFSILLYYWGK